MKNINKIIEQIQQNNFLIIGRAGIDIYPDPPGTKTEDAKHFVTHLGGSTELRMLFGNTIRKNISRNKKMYDRVELLKPTIKEMKKLSKKIISNIGPQF